MSVWFSLGSVAVAAALLCAACSGSEGAPPVVVPADDSSPPPGPPTRKTITLGGAEPTQPRATPTLPPRPPWEPGRMVRVQGTESDHPKLQLMASVPGKVAEYLDLEGGGQTVMYVQRFPRCPGSMEVEGVVMEVRGPTRRPAGSSLDGDAEQAYSELHIDVSRYRCLE